MEIQIRRRITGAVLYKAEARDIRAALISALRGGADLRGADLRGADLSGANLHGARGHWASHAALAEVLRSAAGDSVERRKIAGLVAISTDWCWDRFLAIDDGEKEWALDTLARAASPDDPSIPEAIGKRLGEIRPTETSSPASG